MNNWYNRKIKVPMKPKKKKKIEIVTTKIPKECPYCHANVNFIKDSTIIYGEDYGAIYICSRFPECNARVGVHKGTNRPLGTLANKELRDLRMECHKIFDILWKSGVMSRHNAYKMLRNKMNMTTKQAHIAKFTKEQCEKFLSNF